MRDRDRASSTGRAPNLLRSESLRMDETAPVASSALKSKESPSPSASGRFLLNSSALEAGGSALYTGGLQTVMGITFNRGSVAHNSKWRLCIDFTNVNRACLKDSFPLPRIDLIVDATASHELFSFMDAFSDYNLISMDPDDQEKTSFVRGQGEQTSAGVFGSPEQSAKKDSFASPSLGISKLRSKPG